MAEDLNTLYEKALGASLRNPAPFRWLSSTRAIFDAGERYIIRFVAKRITHPSHGPIYGYQAEFSRSVDEDTPWMYKPTGTGNAFRVFATVLQILREFISKQQPRFVWFLADEPRRVSLYRKMLPLMTPNHYTAEEEGKEGRFTLVRRNT